MKKYRFLVGVLLALACLLALPCLAEEEEEEISYASEPLPLTLSIQSPQTGQTWEAHSCLTVEASCQEAVSLTATLRFPDGKTYAAQADGPRLAHVFAADLAGGEYWTTGAELAIAAQAADGRVLQRTVEIIAPREQFIRDMFAEALRNSTDRQYRFAPAQEDWDVGVCKNFVMRLFDTYSGSYRMAAYPDLKLYMPKNKSKADSAPYDYGIEWRAEGPAEGAPFEIPAQFKYDPDLSKEENMELCRQVLHSVRRGDFFQMVGYYYYGNGPHSLLFMSDWDPVTDQVHWTDSNMKGERVDGVRWGYLQYDAVREAEWFVEAICTKNRGCTIYRLRDDLYIP